MYSTGFSKRKMNNKIAIHKIWLSSTLFGLYFKIYIYHRIPHTLSQVHARKYINAIRGCFEIVPKNKSEIFDKNQFS